MGIIHMEGQAIKFGNLVKWSDGSIFAAGDLLKRLDAKLMEHMRRENKTEYPYNYWENNWQEDEDAYWDIF